jgi:hypothetical protein
MNMQSDTESSEPDTGSDDGSSDSSFDWVDQYYDPELEEDVKYQG